MNTLEEAFAKVKEEKKNRMTTKQRLLLLLGNEEFTADNPDTYRIQGAIADIDGAEWRAQDLLADLDLKDQDAMEIALDEKHNKGL